MYQLLHCCNFAVQLQPLKVLEVEPIALIVICGNRLRIAIDYLVVSSLDGRDQGSPKDR